MILENTTNDRRLGDIRIDISREKVMKIQMSNFPVFIIFFFKAKEEWRQSSSYMDPLCLVNCIIED